jgi:hypothetical protein
MTRLTKAERIQQEGNIVLVLAAIQRGILFNLSEAARVFEINYSTLYQRHRGVATRHDCEPNPKKLTRLGEDTIERYILDLSAKGHSPTLAEVADMARKIVVPQDGLPIGKNWARRFVTRSDELRMAFNRSRDHQRMKQEDPEVISAWFRLVSNFKTKHGIIDEDMYNFDETGFRETRYGLAAIIVTSRY